MAQKKQTSYTDSKGEKWTFKKIFDFLAYIGLCLIGFALCLSFIPEIATPMRQIGSAIAYIITIVVSFGWTKRKKHIAWLVIWIVFAVLVFATFIATLFA